MGLFLAKMCPGLLSRQEYKATQEQGNISYVCLSTEMRRQCKNSQKVRENEADIKIMSPKPQRNTDEDWPESNLRVRKETQLNMG